jgi:hypothetical protein
MPETFRDNLLLWAIMAIAGVFAWFIRGSFVTHTALRPITSKIWDELRETQAELKALKAVLADREARK